MLHVEEHQGVGRVTRAWLWTSDHIAPLDSQTLPVAGTLANDIATHLNLALQMGGQMGGQMCIEIMVPEGLMHLDARQLVWINRGQERNLESLHPVALRWRERMETPADPIFGTGLWYQAAEQIAARRKLRAARAEWMSRNYDIDTFSRAFEQGNFGEFIGLEVESEGEGRAEVVALICNGGLPFACWPRRKGVDLAAAKSQVGNMIAQCSFEEVPGMKNKYPLADLVLLWDDPQRNPYLKMSDVKTI